MFFIPTIGDPSFPSRSGEAGRPLLHRVALVLLTAAVTLSCTHRTSVIQQKRSPDGRLIAYLELIEVEGGVDYISRVVIAPSNKPFDKEKSAAWTYQASTAASPETIAWRDNQHLDVVLPRAVDPRLARIETREVDGVTPKVVILNHS